MPSVITVGCGLGVVFQQPARTPRRRGNPLAIGLAANDVNHLVIKSALQRFCTQNPRRRVVLSTSHLDNLQPLIKRCSNIRHDRKQATPNFRGVVSESWLSLVTCERKQNLLCEEKPLRKSSYLVRFGDEVTPPSMPRPKLLGRGGQHTLAEPRHHLVWDRPY